MDLNIAVWLTGAIIVVGLVEWVKALGQAITDRKVKSIVYAACLPVVAFIVAYSMELEGSRFWVALGIWAIAQIGYELIIQAVRKKLGGK